MAAPVFDTIVAPITALGGAVALVRISGPDAWDFGMGLTGMTHFELRLAHYVRYPFGDDGLATYFDEQSFTGERTVELSLHGSPASMAACLDALISLGARAAQPGEFSLRAFLNGKVDLTQAESIRDLVESKTQLQLRHAGEVRSGALHARLQPILEGLQREIVKLDAHADFSEEIGDYQGDALSAELVSWRNMLEEALGTVRSGRILREGALVALVGPPNSGKSSLLNAILGYDRAIVSSIAGTTRDTLEESVELAGVPVRLVDTAGLRAQGDEIEAMGMARTIEVLAQADLVLAIRSPDTITTTEAEPTHLLIWNKSDLAPPPAGHLSVSAKTGEGLAELRTAIAARIALDEAPLHFAPRHEPYLSRALTIISELSAELPQSELLLQVKLTEALRALQAITGEEISEDMLHRIFADFCIGK